MGVSDRAPVRRQLRRYDNRKLYEPAERRYVTLAQLAELVAQGDELEVRDQKTADDITNAVLAQILFERVKDRSADIPRSVLVRLIRLGAGSQAWPEWARPQEVAARARDEAERIASGLLRRGRLTLDEASSLRQEIAQSAQRLLREAQSGLESRVQRLLESAPDAGPLSFHALKERLLALATEPEAPPAAASATRTPKRLAGRKAPQPTSRRRERSR